MRLIFLTLVFMATSAFGQDVTWHKWNTKNFSIVSVDQKQGETVQQNIEQIKSWIFARWGLPDMNFSAECRIFIVPNKSLMNQLFEIKETSYQVRKTNAGRIEISVIWLLLDKNIAEELPPALTVICLSEYEQFNNKTIPFWIVRGISVLNSTVPRIKEILETKQPILSVRTITTMTGPEWLKTSSRSAFDAEAAALCLLVRKDLVKGLKAPVGVNSIEDAKFKKYLSDINKMPNNYFSW